MNMNITPVNHSNGHRLSAWPLDPSSRAKSRAPVPPASKFTGRNIETITILALVAIFLAGNLTASDKSQNSGGKQSTVITVLPNGSDDTENLQKAFDDAVAAGPGTTVRLVKGIYHTGQIVVNDFRGSFLGAGSQRTVLVNLPNLNVMPENMYYNPPSADNPWPSLVAFVGGNFQVSDLAIHITGPAPTTGWSIFGLPTMCEMAHAFVILGDRANAVFARVDIAGEPAERTLTGYNLINGIVFEGFIGEVSPPISGSFVVRDSTLQHLGSGTPIANVSDASILISGNRAKDVLLGMDMDGLFNLTYEFSFNTVEGVFGIDLYDEGEGGVTSSSKMLIRNNVFSGPNGVFLDETFAGGTHCEVVANNFQKVTGTGVYLGPGTSHCIVAGNTQATIVNLGTHNVIANAGPK